MGLETGTYISDLNAANPVSNDPKSQGDDHLRLLKSTLKTTFPNVTGAMTATQAELNILDGATLTTAELNILAGATLSTAELNLLDGCTVTLAELNYLMGLTGNIQNQLDLKAPLASPVFTGVPAGPTAAPGTTTTQLATTAFVMAAAFVAAGNVNFQYFTSNSTAILHMEHLLDSSSGSFTVTMPAAPTNGDIITVSDPLGSWSTYPVTLDGNGSNFVDALGNSVAENFTLNSTALQTITFMYTTNGWRAI